VLHKPFGHFGSVSEVTGSFTHPFGAGLRFLLVERQQAGGAAPMAWARTWGSPGGRLAAAWRLGHQADGAVLGPGRRAVGGGEVGLICIGGEQEATWAMTALSGRARSSGDR